VFFYEEKLKIVCFLSKGQKHHLVAQLLFVLPSMGFELTPLKHCSTNRLVLCICFSPRVHLSWILGQKHENNTKNADFWKLFIEEKANAEQIIQLSHTM
jgi:hypothetical protein